jgi:hypothetical protein
VRRSFLAATFLSALVWFAGGLFAADDSSTAKAETFFAGTVTEWTAEKMTVGRTVRGKAESRTFSLTPETKVEGALAVKERVTVRYFTDDDGDTAILIVVRAVNVRGSKKK